ncbi:MAG: hypothetical protein KAH44_03860 [Oricola sp.]|nr:hypothetical protein [Oricola sp.]
MTDAPLAIDLDGTLHSGDMSLMLFRSGLRKNPVLLITFPLAWIYFGKGAAKLLAEKHGKIDFEGVDWSQEVLRYARAAKQSGRKLILATGTPQATAEACNKALGGLFDQVMGTSEKTNLIGQAKAEALCLSCHVYGYDYIGNSKQDIPVWRSARQVLIAYAPESVKKEAMVLGRKVAKVFS